MVDAGREDLSRKKVEALATGEVYTANEALASGLIDGVGYLNAAIDKAAELANVGAGVTPHVTRVRRDGGLMGLLGAQRSLGRASDFSLAGLSADDVRTLLEDMGQARLSYRMQLR